DEHPHELEEDGHPADHPQAAAVVRERDGRDQVDDGGERREPVGQRGLGRVPDQLHGGAGGRGDGEDAVDDDEHPPGAERGPAGIGGGGQLGHAVAHHSVSTRYCITSSASASTSSTTELQRVRSAIATTAPAGSIST